MSDHLRTDYDRMVGESYKEYAARMRGRALAAEKDRDALRAELNERRDRVTTGGPPPKTTQGWKRGPSSRPPTAPPDDEVVELLAVDYVDEPPPN